MAETQETANKQLNCPICLEIFESPKVLECLHTFCEKCICKHARSLREAGTQSDIVTCPVCRNPTPAPAAVQTPDEWAAKLCSNSIVVSLLGSTQSHKDDSVYCQPCVTLGEENVSVAYCVTCSEYLCNICYTRHKSFKMSKDHSVTVQLVSALQNRNSSHEGMYRCSIHLKQYEYFCSDHNEFCCIDCAIKDHRKCDELLPMKDLSKSTKEGQDFKEVSERLDAVKKMFITLHESRSKNFESIVQQKTEITKSIHDWIVTFKELIDGLKTAVLEELDQMCKQETVTISDQIVECKSAIAAIETSEKMLKGGKKSEDDTNIFITMTKVSRQVPNYLEKYKTLEKIAEIVELEFHRDNTCEGIIKTFSSIGKLKRRTTKISKMSSDSSFSTSEMVFPKIQPNLMVTFGAKIPVDDQTCRICSGVFLLDERLVLSDSLNMKLKLFDRCFQFVSYLKMEYEPMYICRVDEGTVAVTVGTNINLVSVDKTLTPLRSISVGQPCYAIASYQTNIIVGIYGPEKTYSLLTYDTSDSIINRIMSYDKLSSYNTHCVSQDGQRIYYTTKDAVVTMDMKGNKLNIFESIDLKGALGITVDKQGIIYCCGLESETVIQITPDGRQLGVLLSRNYGLLNPRGICLNYRKDTILVFEEGSNDVKVFTNNLT